MLNPLSALLLSQFVLGLGSHVDAFCKAQRPAGDCRLSWRADQTDLSERNVTTCCIQHATAADYKGARGIASWVRPGYVLVYVRRILLLSDLSVDAKVNQPHLEALCLRRMHRKINTYYSLVSMTEAILTQPSKISCFKDL